MHEKRSLKLVQSYVFFTLLCTSITIFFAKNVYVLDDEDAKNPSVRKKRNCKCALTDTRVLQSMHINAYKILQNLC